MIQFGVNKYDLNEKRDLANTTAVTNIPHESVPSNTDQSSSKGFVFPNKSKPFHSSLNFTKVNGTQNQQNFLHKLGKYGSWENSYRKPQCYFCSHFSWLMQHFHSHMLLTVSLVSKFQNLFFPASQLVIWRAGKRKSRGTSTATQYQGRLLHDQREWN